MKAERSIGRASLDPVGTGAVLLNGAPLDQDGYQRFHERRIGRTIERLRRAGASRVMELGGHPWVMTAALTETAGIRVVSSVSAEEVTRWPDDIGVSAERYRLRSARGNVSTFTNYSANLERTLFDISEAPDAVLACEILEHLVRAPHVMILNINRWLPTGGTLLITTPNGFRVENPLRRRSNSPAYRSNVYERHSHLWTMDELVDMVNLCGFRVREAEYWDPYPRRGLACMYTALARVPVRWVQEKFASTIYLLAEKERDVTALERVPLAYDPRGDWEHMVRNPRITTGTEAG